MKHRKKTMTALAFALGTCLFVTTALADMALGSGYDRLKQTVKHTASQMEQGLTNYTMESFVSLKANQHTLTETSSVQKIDMEKQMTEHTSSSQSSNGEVTSHYRYSDQTMSVWKNSRDDTYYVTEYAGSRNRKPFTNPFNEEGAAEVEKIFDALVGNLKDHVQVEEKTEGGRLYLGSLTETQVPALANAVSSFLIKQMINEQNRADDHSNWPEMENDIYVKKVSGKALENDAGLMESVTGEVVLSGKDKQGVEHDLTLNMVFKLSDIGNTTVVPPDLTGENVEKLTETKTGFTGKYVGTYKNNIIVEKDDQFVKAGERVLEIISVENDKVTGKYTEIVKPEFASEIPEPYNLTFEFVPDDSNPMRFFTYTNAKGEQESGQIHVVGPGKLYLELGIEIVGEHSYRSNPNHEYFDGEFRLVFEE